MYLYIKNLLLLSACSTPFIASAMEKEMDAAHQPNTPYRGHLSIQAPYSSSSANLETSIESGYPSQWEDLSIPDYFNLLQKDKLPSKQNERKKYIEQWYNGMFNILQFDLKDPKTAHITIARCLTSLAQTIKHNKINGAIIKNYFKGKPQFLSLWQNMAIQKINQFNSQGLTNSLWAIATLGLKTDCAPFLKLWPEVATKIINQFNPQELANSLWAHALLEISPPVFLRQHIEDKLQKFTHEQRHSLYLAKQFFSNIPILSNIVFESMLEKIKNKSIGKISTLQNSVAVVLETIYPQQVEQEYWFEEIASRCDFFLPSQKTIIEADGHHHFIGLTHEYWPADLLRDKILNQYHSNLKIIRIPYWEWDCLSNLQDQIEYVKRKIMDSLKEQKDEPSAFIQPVTTQGLNASAAVFIPELHPNAPSFKPSTLNVTERSFIPSQKGSF